MQQRTHRTIPYVPYTRHRTHTGICFSWCIGEKRGRSWVATSHLRRKHSLSRGASHTPGVSASDIQQRRNRGNTIHFRPFLPLYYRLYHFHLFCIQPRDSRATTSGRTPDILFFFFYGIIRKTPSRSFLHDTVAEILSC